MAAVLVLVWWRHGAELMAPANPAENYSAARPDWYFMGLFQLLKFQDKFQGLPGGGLLWCAVIIPSILAVFLFLMPFIGRWRVGSFFQSRLALGRPRHLLRAYRDGLLEGPSRSAFHRGG
jgi:ubiquinol-cytochrome c reductase cytochrome b subunit